MAVYEKNKEKKTKQKSQITTRKINNTKLFIKQEMDKRASEAPFFICECYKKKLK